MKKRHLERTKVTRKTGKETLTMEGRSIGFDLLRFWQWSCSDMVNSTNRDRMAEYIVACDLDRTDNVRKDWGSFNMLTQSGIEVVIKSASPVQSWGQNDYSRIVFDIAPKGGWDKDRDKEERANRPRAWVFGVFDPRKFPVANPMDLDQWRFYIMPSSLLEQHLSNHKKVTLSKLEKLGLIEARYGRIGTTIDLLFRTSNPATAA